jgi:hypothetical protein
MRGERRAVREVVNNEPVFLGRSRAAVTHRGSDMAGNGEGGFDYRPRPFIGTLRRGGRNGPGQ